MKADSIATLTKLGLEHSIAQAFLIFSGALVIVSVWSAEQYVLVSFFTLFYALIAHSLTALRKHESLGEYFVGSSKSKTILFTISYILYFVWWTTGTWTLLNSMCILNLLCLHSKHFVDITLLSFSLGLSITIFMLLWFFLDLPKQDKNGFYTVKRLCKNCDSNIEVKIQKGVPFERHSCPTCSIAAFSK